MDLQVLMDYKLLMRQFNLYLYCIGNQTSPGFQFILNSKLRGHKQIKSCIYKNQDDK